MEKENMSLATEKIIEVADMLKGLPKDDIYDKVEVAMGCVTFLVGLALKEDDKYGDCRTKDVFHEAIDTLYNEAKKED